MLCICHCVAHIVWCLNVSPDASKEVCLAFETDHRCSVPDELDCSRLQLRKGSRGPRHTHQPAEAMVYPHSIYCARLGAAILKLCMLHNTTVMLGHSPHPARNPHPPTAAAAAAAAAAPQPLLPAAARPAAAPPAAAAAAVPCAEPGLQETSCRPGLVEAWGTLGPPWTGAAGTLG